MELKDFIRTTLVEIVEGVAGASAEVANHGAVVGGIPAYGASVPPRHADHRMFSSVEFDIVLARGDSTDTKGGIGVFLGSVGLGSQGASHGETASHSRIKFTVPLVLPPPKS
jgi:hypothetical protein